MRGSKILLQQFSSFIDPVHLSLNPRFSHVKDLNDGSIAAFQREAFNPAQAAVLPRGHFSDLPALHKWFTLTSGKEEMIYELNQVYFEHHCGAVVPLELTRLASPNHADHNDDTFSRFEAPLYLFFQWIQQAKPDTIERLYLAQAPVADLPQQVKDDLPVPDLVRRAGRGDIYDTNLWIGLAPTYTPLHKDPNPNLFVQLAGRKMVRLFEPEIGMDLFARVQEKLGRDRSSAFRGDEMMKGEEKRILEDEVWNDEMATQEDHIEGYQTILERGDGLFIPKGWWHSIKGVGQGVSGSVRRLLDYYLAKGICR
ncbi:MAG: hypothetical protein M1827_006421 [Pycnora praestabilis]|nr:MAG: hypothetical protein M1827_006421 [Pycnora praestabilis]